MDYDLIIIGAGPAGLTASIYASRYKLKNLVVGSLLGGTITYAHKVDNFPGLPGISGLELGQKMVEQAKALGGEVLAEEVKAAERTSEGFKVRTSSGKEFEAKGLILAMGTERRKLGVPGEEEYLGRGVSYCTTCDGFFYKGKKVVLVGGSNAACSGAVFLARLAEKVYLIYRKSTLRAEPIWVREVQSNPKIEVIYETNIKEIKGDGNRVTEAILDKPYLGKNSLEVQGVFIEIGGVPAAKIAHDLGVETEEEGYLKIDEMGQTNVEGIWAAGDVTDKSKILSQAITACAWGAVAANSAYEYLKKKGS